MREGWMYKKLPDVLWFQEGPGVRKHQYRETGVKLINVANLVHGKVDLTTSKRYISEEEAYGKYSHFMIDAGDFIIASSGIQVETMDEKCGFIQEWQLPLCMNTSTIRFKSLDSKQLDIKFFSYFVKSAIYKDQIEKLITGIAQLNFGPSHLKKVQIPIPPLSTQQQIVSELDLLSHILDQKRQQLKEYDALAESIFYDMFGDPVENPKGWEVKKLKEVCSKITDGTHRSPQNFPEGQYKYITAKNIKKDGFCFNELTFVSKEDHEEIFSRCKPEYGDVLYIKDGITTGIAMVNTLEEEFSLLSSVALLKLEPIINNKYLCAVLNHPTKYKEIRSDMGGAAITRLTLKKIEMIKIPLPPLTLQRSFAAKIQSIEHQKQLLRASIKETEMLFQSRMDYWFNS